MSDERLRELQRQAESEPENAEARYRFRLECVRQGRPELAGFLPGDKVWRTEDGREIVGRDDLSGPMWVREAMRFTPDGKLTLAHGREKSDFEFCIFTDASRCRLIEPVKPGEEPIVKRDRNGNEPLWDRMRFAP